MLCVCLCEDMLDFQTRRGEEREGGREAVRWVVSRKMSSCTVRLNERCVV